MQEEYMTQEEILKYNKRCSEFLGGVYDSDITRYWFYLPVKWDGVFAPTTGELRFHSDWNWIMEVVEAIEKLGFNFDSYNPIGIGKDGFYEFNIFNKNIEMAGRGNTSKKAYINAINQFLIWYNENNK